MSSDDRQTSVPPAVTVEPAETEATLMAADLLAPAETTAPLLVEPETLARGLRYLQQRVPEFTQLTLHEKRTHSRAANLDPEVMEHGLHTACVWRETEKTVRRSGEQLREEHEHSRHWDEVIREIRALLDGIEAGNTKRKHRLGTAILTIYRILSIQLQGDNPEYAYIRPYYENMKRAYLRTHRFRKRKKKGGAGEGEGAGE